jgi:hypothetical protein
LRSTPAWSILAEVIASDRRLRLALIVASLVGCAERRADRDASAAAPGDDEASMQLSATMDDRDPPPPTAAAAVTGPALSRPPATIFREELHRATDRGPAYLLRQLGPEPFRHHGVFVGWEITRIFPDDPHVCAPGCDVQVGDVILSVNGSTLETPQAFADALDALPKADRLVVHSLREGKRRQRTYRIVDAAAP